MAYSQKSSLYFKNLFGGIKENIQAKKRIKEDISGAGTGEGTVRVFNPQGERKELKTRKYVKEAMKTFKSGGGEPMQVTDLEGKYIPSVGYERRMQLQEPTKEEIKTKKPKSKFKYRTGGVKQKPMYLRKGKFIG